MSNGEEARKAAAVILDPEYVRLVVRQDADAACAAALLGHALRREKVDFHVTWHERLDKAAAARFVHTPHDALVLIGLGEDADLAAVAGHPLVTLDRHAVPAGGRAHLSGDAVEGGASLAALACDVATAMLKSHRDLAPLALAGATASWRDLPGHYTGRERDLVTHAVDSEVIANEPALALSGPTLTNALTRLEAPYVSGISGVARNAKKLLRAFHLPPEAPMSHLQREHYEQLGSYLSLRLLQQDAPDAALDALFRPIRRVQKGPLSGLDAVQIGRLTEACGAAGQWALAYAVAWGDAVAITKAKELEGTWRPQLVDALRRSEADVEQATALSATPELALPLARRAAVSFTSPRGEVVVRASDRLVIARGHAEGTPLLPRASQVAAKLGARCQGDERHAVLFGAPDALLAAWEETRA